jgi:PAS domain S-box-containing protein
LLPWLVGLATVLGVVAIYGIVRQNVGQIRTLSEDRSLVEHTLDVERTLESLMVELNAAESAQRGYLLTGSDESFAAYKAATARVPTALDQLDMLLNDNPGQRARLVRIREVVNARLAALANTVEIRQQLGLAAAAAAVASLGAEKLMEEIRSNAAQMSKEEADLLAARRERAALAYRSAVGGRIGSGVVSALLLLGMAGLVTARVRAQERSTRHIAEEREHLRVTLASIGDGVIATDVEGRITLMNGVASALTGWPAEEAVGRPVSEVFVVISKDTRQPAEDPVARALRRAAANPADHTLLVSRNGREVPIDDSGALIRDIDGDLKGSVLVFRDVTDRHARDQALRDTQQQYREAAEREQTARAQAEEANRLKDEFLAVLSHELRTPLNAVLGWTQILQAGAAGEAAEARALASIRRNAEAQQRLVEDLLDVSRIVTGKFPLDRRPIEVGPAVTAAIDAVRPDADAKSLVLTANIGTALAANADPHRVQQVALNLLTNAVKFTPERGRIDIALAAIPGAVRLTVADSGQGISRELLPHMFDRFRQGDGSTTRAHGGLGLGLAIVKHIVEAHGGTITASSEGLGRGATFAVDFPTADFSAQEAGLMASPTEGTGDVRLTGISALVVDDEQDSRELLEFALRQAGAAVTAVSSAPEALQRLNDRRPTIVLTDIQMPDMDGVDLLEEMKQRFHSSAPPAIAITARVRSDDVRRAASAGFAAHVTKPVDLSLLMRTIRSVVQGEATSQMANRRS